uniref:large ribosomal subunit protein mL44 n=1 Tax=Myxine glutinosa TaxID=7769 RepID=UPI00358F4971
MAAFRCGVRSLCPFLSSHRPVLSQLLRTMSIDVQPEPWPPVPAWGRKRWLQAWVRKERDLNRGKVPIEVPRSQKPNWDYDAELLAFTARLGEKDARQLLRLAFSKQCYSGNEGGELCLEGTQLLEEGERLAVAFLNRVIVESMPALPASALEALTEALLGEEALAKVARDLGMAELIVDAEFPVSKSTLRSAVFAVLGAIARSGGSERAELFVRDFVLPPLSWMDLFEVWSVEDPMAVLAQEMEKCGEAPPETRLTRQTGIHTLLPIYFVGIYSAGNLLAEAPGDGLFAAEEEAARTALRHLYGFTDNRRPLSFRPTTPYSLPTQLIEETTSQRSTA